MCDLNRGLCKRAAAYKWVMLALLSCAFFFHQADRVLFGLLTIPIQEDLHPNGDMMVL